MTIGTPNQRLNTLDRPVPWYYGSDRNARLAKQILAALAAGTVLGLSVILIPYVPELYLPFVVLALVFPFAAMMVGSARKLLLAAVIFDIAFPVDFHLDYHAQEASFGAIGGLEISITTMALTVLYALWILDLVVKARSQSRPRGWLGPGIPLMIYVGFAALSAIVAQNAELSLFEVSMLFQTLLLFIYIVGTVRTREDIIFMATLLLGTLVLESLLMIAAPFGLRFKIGSIVNRVDTASPRVAAGLFRTAGTVGSPILAASFVELLLAPAMSVLFMPVERWLKWLAGLGVFFGSVALILTFSRGGWIAAGLSVFVLCYFAWRRRWLSPVIPAGMIAVALVMGIVFQSQVMQRVFNEQSAYDRIPLAEIASRVIMDHPLLGVGSNNIVLAELNYVTPDLAGAWLYAIHDKYLLVWSETGIGALIAFLAFLGMSLRRGWQAWKMHDRLLSPLALALALGIGGEMIHMLVDVFNSRPQVQELWVLAALITAIYNLEKVEWRAAH